MRAELKFVKSESVIQKQDAISQTKSHPDIPYKLTDPLPPIFSMELRHKSRPIHFLSRSIPNLTESVVQPAKYQFKSVKAIYIKYPPYPSGLPHITPFMNV